MRETLKQTLTLTGATSGAGTCLPVRVPEFSPVVVGFVLLYL